MLSSLVNINAYRLAIVNAGNAAFGWVFVSRRYISYRSMNRPTAYTRKLRTEKWRVGCICASCLSLLSGCSLNMRMCALLIAASVACSNAGSSNAWPPSAYTRAQAKLAQMTLSQKLALVYGYGGGYVLRLRLREKRHNLAAVRLHGILWIPPLSFRGSRVSHLCIVQLRRRRTGLPHAWLASHELGGRPTRSG
jgi:hypothetical protein